MKECRMKRLKLSTKKEKGAVFFIEDDVEYHLIAWEEGDDL